jgi:hypothetical protein
MAWKPKTIAGKILKGVAIGGAGVTALATGVGAVGGVIGGTGLLAGAVKGVGSVVKAVGGGVKTVASKVSAGAVKLVTGQSKEDLQLVKEVKAETKAAAAKLDLVNRLEKAGASPEAARMKAGLSNLSIPKLEGLQDTPADAQKKTNMLVYAGLGLAALFLLPKLLKR